jgi:hypothetical protein
MWCTTKIAVGLMCLVFFVAGHAQAKDACNLRSLAHQQRDEATIQNLETAWNIAMSRGDTDFELCLLTPDFMEILPNGELKTLTDQLGFTEKNQEQNKPVAELPKIKVLIHGNVAVAHATWKPTEANRKPDQTADFFIWEKRHMARLFLASNASRSQIANEIFGHGQ